MKNQWAISPELSSLAPRRINKHFQHLHVECMNNSGSLGYKFKVDDTSNVEKADQHYFDLRLWYPWLLRSGRILLSPLHLLSFGLGFVLITPRFITSDDTIQKLSSWSCSLKSMHKVRRLSFCSSVKFRGTSFTANFLIPRSRIRRFLTVCMLTPSSSATILQVNRRSVRISSLGFATFSSLSLLLEHLAFQLLCLLWNLCAKYKHYFCS
jgi:hypothetical protein